MSESKQQVAASKHAARLKMEFGHLARAEPRLLALLSDINTIGIEAKHARSFCANEAWYGRANSISLKMRLCKIIGWHRPDDSGPLASRDAYDVAYDFLYSRLPGCRRCQCTR